MTTRPLQVIETSAGGSELTWPFTLYELTGYDITACPVTYALVKVNTKPQASDFHTVNSPGSVVFGTMTAAAFRALNPAIAYYCTVPDSTVIHFAVLRVSITSSIGSGSFDLYGQLVTPTEDIIRKADAMIVTS